MKSQKYKPPKPSTGDTGYLVTNALLSLVPGAPELFQRFVTPPLEIRREKWMEEVGQALQDLEQNRGINLEDLQSNEVFITVLMQASQSAIRNHQQEKLQALHNAVINSATGVNIQEDLQLILLRYVDELVPSHLTLLKFFCDNEEKLAYLESYKQLHQEFSKQHQNIADRDEFKLLCGDLTIRGLLRISQEIEDHDDIYQRGSYLLLEGPKEELPILKVTELGHSLLAFITKSSRDTAKKSVQTDRPSKV